MNPTWNQISHSKIRLNLSSFISTHTHTHTHTHTYAQFSTYVLARLPLWFHCSRGQRSWPQSHPPRTRERDTRMPTACTLPGGASTKTCCRCWLCERVYADEWVCLLNVRSAPLPTCLSVCVCLCLVRESQVGGVCVCVCLCYLSLSVCLTFYSAAGPPLCFSTPHSPIQYLSLLPNDSPPLSPSLPPSLSLSLSLSLRLSLSLSRSFSLNAEQSFGRKPGSVEYSNKSEGLFGP